MSSAKPDLPQVDLKACQVSQWYPLFASVAYKTRIVELTADEEAYLTSDNISATDVPQAMPRHPRGPGDADQDIADAAEAGSTSSSECGTECQFAGLNALKTRVNSAIERLHGPVLAKLNWSSPKDAVWLSPNGLVCNNVDEVLLLLKSSDRIAHDVDLLRQLRSQETQSSHVSDQREGVERQWPACIAIIKQYHLRPEREFRCFVKHHQLLGISQRDPTQHFPQLQAELTQIKEAVQRFHEFHVFQKHSVSNYTYDVYITTKNIVRILDFGPVGVFTSPLLFEWDELYGDTPAHAEQLPPDQHSPHELAGAHNLSQDLDPAASDESQNDAVDSRGCKDDVSIRIVEDASHIQTGAATAFSAPVDVASMHGMGWQQVIAHMQQCTMDYGSDDASD